MPSAGYFGDQAIRFHHAPLDGQQEPSPMRYGGLGSFALVAGDVLVQVGQTAGHRLRYVTQLAPGYRVALQVVRQRALHTHTHILILYLNPQIILQQTGFKYFKS